MKTTIYTSSGEKKGTIELPKIFSSPIREDLVMKHFEVSKTKQPYSPKIGAGIRQQGYNQISHKRHDWKGHYGKGISRVPRKTMSRRGTNFYWVASNMPSARAAKGKKRRRKYKSNAGILILMGKEEKAIFKGFDIRNVQNVEVPDLYTLG